MLPRRLYEILPYIYVTTGIVSALLISSRLIFISSMLMIMAGLIVLSMRISNRREPEPRRIHAEGGHVGMQSRRFKHRSDRDRRQRDVPGFPIIDSSGRQIEFDRRMADRRLSSA